MSDKNFTKVKYTNDEKRIKPVSWIICSILFVLAALDTVFLHLSVEGVLSKIPVMVIIVIILLASQKIAARQEREKNHRKELVKYGERCEGKIIAINEHKYYSTTMDHLCYSYSLSAEYYSEKSGCYKRIDSGILAQTPTDVVGNDCIVYEYNGEAIIDSVDQLSDKKMSPANAVLLIITIALFGFAAWFFSK